VIDIDSLESNIISTSKHQQKNYLCIITTMIFALPHINQRTTQRSTRVSLTLLIIALLINSIIPIGFMPSTVASSGWLSFCPDYSYTSQTSQHADHHSENSENFAQSFSACVFAHLNLGSSTLPSVSVVDVIRQSFRLITATISRIAVYQRYDHYHTRAPPHHLS